MPRSQRLVPPGRLSSQRFPLSPEIVIVIWGCRWRSDVLRLQTIMIWYFEVAGDDDLVFCDWNCNCWSYVLRLIWSPWASQSHRQHWIQDLSCPSPSVKILRIPFRSEYCKSILLWVKIFVTMMLMHLFKFYSVDRHRERLWSASRNSAPRTRSATNNHKNISICVFYRYLCQENQLPDKVVSWRSSEKVLDDIKV